MPPPALEAAVPPSPAQPLLLGLGDRRPHDCPGRPSRAPPLHTTAGVAPTPQRGRGVRQFVFLVIVLFDLGRLVDGEV